MRLDFTGVDERISEWQFRSGNFGAAILDRYNGTMVLWYYVTMLLCYYGHHNGGGSREPHRVR